jgi:polysaccharide deacetylase 2 family uncharacterized protein YibQ
MAMKRLLAILACAAIASLALSCGQRDGSGDIDYHTGEYTEDDWQDEAPTDTSQVTDKADKAGKPGLPLAGYKYTWTDSEDIPRIVVIVDDFGQSTALLKDYAELPPEVVFAVLPDLPATKKAGEMAAQYGHEVIIHVPMQPKSSDNPGKTYIKTSSTEDDISSMLSSFHSQLPMAIGVNNHMGSAVTSDRDAMEMVFRQLHNQGLFFVDSYTSGESVGPSLARSLGYPALKRDIFLDVPDNTDATLASKISSLGKYKGRREPIIIITHCHNRGKLESLRKFITQIQGMGLKLTTLSEARDVAA